MDAKVKAAVAKHYDVKPEQIVKLREEESNLVALIDYGKGGIKKYRELKTEMVRPPKKEVK